MNPNGPLVIVSCSQRKIWDNNSWAGPTAARDAYRGPVFSVSREYAEKLGERWVILSAKYGFIEPDFVIQGNYDVRMGEPGSISPNDLAAQVRNKGLAKFKKVDVLGSFDYFSATRMAFGGTESIVRHVNEGVGYAPSFIKIVKGIIAAKAPALRPNMRTCCPRTPRDEPLVRNPEYGKPEQIAKVVPALLQYSRNIDPAELFPASEPQAAKLIAVDPYAFLLAACLDRGIKAETIWNIPYDIKNVLGRLDPFEIARFVCRQTISDSWADFLSYRFRLS